MAAKSEELGTLFLFSDEPEDYQKSRWPFVNYLKKKLKVGIWDREKKRQALIQKSGQYRVKYQGIKNKKSRFLQDLYVTLIDLKWRYALAILFNVYLFSYLIFAVFWYWLMSNHGDFEHLNDPDWKPCVDGVRSFGNAFLFSIETQTTIGYGFAYPNTDCNGTLLLTFLQVTVGIILENILLGFMFMKFAQPKRRGKTLIFSKHACINFEDGVMCLQIRLGDMRQSHLVDAKVHGLLVKKKVTKEGYSYPLYLHNLEFEANDMGDKIVLMWPMVLKHNITESSPLWDIRPADLSSEKYEIIIFAEGTIESTGEFCQARSSYLPTEILWGHRFDRIEQFDTGNGRWEVDFAGFNDVIYNNNIRHSAKELDGFKTKNKPKSPPPPRPPSPVKTVTYDLPPEYPAVISPSQEESIDYTKPVSSISVLKRLSKCDSEDACSEATDDTVIERDLGEGGTIHSSDDESYGDAEETCNQISATCTNTTDDEGEDNITTYTFNTHQAKHTFCKTCGVQCFYTPRSNPDGYGVVPHCIDSDTVDNIKEEWFDGQNWEKHINTTDIQTRSKE